MFKYFKIEANKILVLSMTLAIETAKNLEPLLVYKMESLCAADGSKVATVMTHRTLPIILKLLV